MGGIGIPTHFHKNRKSREQNSAKARHHRACRPEVSDTSGQRIGTITIIVMVPIPCTRQMIVIAYWSRPIVIITMDGKVTRHSHCVGCFPRRSSRLSLLLQEEVFVN